MDSNVINSHIVYKVKVEENIHMRIKASICPHGNRDKMKGKIRKDSVSDRFDVIMLLLSMATILGFHIGCIDIKSAYLQSGPIKRTIYVRPPRGLKYTRIFLWKLSKLPCGIFESFRL